MQTTRLIALVTTGANTKRKVEGVTVDRRISCKRKGNLLSSCVKHECIRDDGTSRETTAEGSSLQKTTW